LSSTNNQVCLSLVANGKINSKYEFLITL